MKHDTFFNEEIARCIKNLHPNTEPKWGTMRPVDMIIHLRQAIAMSIDGSGREIHTPEEKLPAAKKFLMSDKPLPLNRTKPAAFNKYKISETELFDQKIEFLRDVITLQVHFDKHPEFTSVHPSFGELNKEEWMQLHYKHFRHHFEQFNLLEQ